MEYCLAASQSNARRPPPCLYMEVRHLSALLAVKQLSQTAIGHSKLRVSFHFCMSPLDDAWPFSRSVACALNKGALLHAIQPCASLHIDNARPGLCILSPAAAECLQPAAPGLCQTPGRSPARGNARHDHIQLSLMSQQYQELWLAMAGCSVWRTTSCQLALTHVSAQSGVPSAADARTCARPSVQPQGNLPRAAYILLPLEAMRGDAPQGLPA